ncbi:Uncharacterised protein [Salmonella enterica subsp. arizonae]|nr:Uncharacterised protein [Salmonella enterica subsp. arizonae]
MLPLALGEDIHCAIAVRGDLKRGRRRYRQVIFSAKCVRPWSASRRLLLRRRLLLSGKAFATDTALSQLNPAFCQLGPQHRQGGFQRGADMAMRRHHLELRLIVIQLERNMYLT